ncbi:MAG: DinB family protein [Anaerolineales bacterium]
METIEFIRQLFTAVRRQADEAMKDLTVEQFNWAPPGSANPISAIFVHVLNSEDSFIQTLIQGKPKLWDAGGWAEKTGVKVPPGYAGGWEEVKSMTLAIEPLLAYQQAVRAATEAYLDSLTPQELERVVKSARGERSVATMMIHLVDHALIHAGEIGVLKGIQAGKNL